MRQPSATTRDGVPIVQHLVVYTTSVMGDAVAPVVVGSVVADPTTHEARVYADGRLLFPADCWASESLASAARAEQLRRDVAFLRRRLAEAETALAALEVTR